MGLLLGPDAALPGRVVIGVAEVLRVWEFQDEADTAVVRGEGEDVQVALGGVGGSRRRSSGRGFSDLDLCRVGLQCVGDRHVNCR